MSLLLCPLGDGFQEQKYSIGLNPARSRARTGTDKLKTAILMVQEAAILRNNADHACFTPEVWAILFGYQSFSPFSKRLQRMLPRCHHLFVVDL
jgi:hypothetical protein